MTAKPALLNADIPDEWIAAVREAMRRDGQAVRGPFYNNAIEVKSLTTNQWLALMLPGGAMGFTCEAERNAALARITAFA